MDRQRWQVTPVKLVAHPGAAQLHDAEVPAVVPVVAPPVSLPDHAQAQLLCPPQRQMQHQQQAIEMRQARYRTPLDVEAAPLGVGLGGVGMDPSAVLPDP